MDLLCDLVSSAPVSELDITLSVNRLHFVVICPTCWTMLITSNRVKTMYNGIFSWRDNFRQVNCLSNSAKSFRDVSWWKSRVYSLMLHSPYLQLWYYGKNTRWKSAGRKCFLINFFILGHVRTGRWSCLPRDSTACSHRSDEAPFRWMTTILTWFFHDVEEPFDFRQPIQHFIDPHLTIKVGNLHLHLVLAKFIVIRLSRWGW